MLVQRRIPCIQCMPRTVPFPVYLPEWAKRAHHAEHRRANWCAVATLFGTNVMTRKLTRCSEHIQNAPCFSFMSEQEFDGFRFNVCDPVFQLPVSHQDQVTGHVIHQITQA